MRPVIRACRPPPAACTPRRGRSATTAGRAQAFGLRDEPGGVAHRGHLDARLGAVDEAVEHLRIDRSAVLDLQILVEDLPHGVGRGVVIVRLVARALAGGDHLEAAGARPVDMLADQRRLIAPGEAVDDARAFALRASSGPATASASTLTMTMCLPWSIDGQRVADAGAGSPVASTITSMSGNAIRASASGVTWVRPVLKRVAERGGADMASARPSRRGAAGAGALDVEVGDADEVDAARERPAPGTWCRTCRRRSGRRSRAGRRPPVRAAWREDSLEQRAA